MHDSGLRRGIYTAAGIVFLAIMLFPIYWMVNSSFQSNAGATNNTFFPVNFTLDGYTQAIQEQGANLATSLIVSLGTVALSLIIAAPAAYALAKFRVKAISIVLFALLITQMIPGIVIANALYTLYNSAGLLNSIPGLILADAALGIPFSILILRAFMLSIPASLIEAARVDGAGHFRAFASIVLPISKNAVITAALFSFLFTWSDFLFALTLTSTDAVRPVTLGIYNYIGANVNNWAPVMATGVLSAIPAVIMLIIAQRYISAGAVGGAIK